MVSIESINPGYNGKPIFEGNKGTLGKDDFLTLLTVQMQNQDPFKPMDPSEFTAQLTQFEELEQLFNISESLEYLTLYQNSLVNTEAMNFIDKTIKALGNSR